jgi:hypothetical protein
MYKSILQFVELPGYPNEAYTEEPSNQSELQTFANLLLVRSLPMIVMDTHLLAPAKDANN